MSIFHPQKDDQGKPVALKQPHQPTPLTSWDDANDIATVTPDSPMPVAVAGLAIEPWTKAPSPAAGWELLANAMLFDEPPLKTIPGKPHASGAVVFEPDGRIWVISPSNRFGGYLNTFPKGKLDANEGLTLRANALKEVFEETGLQVELTEFLCDSERSTSLTRYYLARRVGGNPANMGWESQAVHLVPAALLAKFASHPNDQFVVQALIGKGFHTK